MAEERNVGLARAPETNGDDDSSKAELQRRMEEARESITQTVTEIKDTVANQYQSVKDTISETLDWREQYRKRPVAWSVGALGAGFLVGYGIASAFKGDGESYSDYEYEGSSASSPAPPRSYAAQAITGGAYGSSAYAPSSASAGAHQESAGDYRPSYSTGYAGTADPTRTEEPDKPGLLERFKETAAYDRLQDEVATLGDRLMNELSQTAQAVVLPALFSKLKDYFGVDLSNKQQGQSRTSRGGTQQRANAASAGGASTGSSTQTSSQRGASSYGTSENRDYNTSSGGA